MRRLTLVLPVLAFLGCQCSGSGPQCKSDGDCGTNAVCLQIGQCAPSCGGKASACLAGEKCSAGGGCIASGSCGADGDCGNGQLCQQGACGAACTAMSCGSGEACGADGHCMPVMMSNGGGAGGGGNSCGGQLFQATKVDANFLIVLDHSGSMMENVAGTPKWTAAVQALKNITAQYQSQIRFGLSMFSTPTHCDPGKNYVPVGDNTAVQIAAAFPATADGNGTPIGGALHLAGMEAGLMDPTRANFVMLVTDGEENCGGNPVNETKTLSMAGIKTFVVGFGGSVNSTTLNNMAVNGGTARNTMPRYYQADDPTSLTNAFSQIAQGALGCDYHLQSTPPDPSKLYVYVNGMAIPQDPGHHVGWDYSSATNDLTLYGTVCDAVANDPTSKVNIVYGCPDTSVVEGGGSDGGTIDLDAGVIIN
jgi:hypothetical protein